MEIVALRHIGRRTRNDLFATLSPFVTEPSDSISTHQRRRIAMNDIDHQSDVIGHGEMFIDDSIGPVVENDSRFVLILLVVSKSNFELDVARRRMEQRKVCFQRLIE